MVYTGQPSRGCATCRKRRIKCDEKAPECGNCQRIKQTCPGYVNQFDLAWRDQTTVAKRGVERGKQKRKAAREQASSSSRTSSLSSQASQSSRPIQPASGRKESLGKTSPTSSVKTSGSPSAALVSKGSSISSHSLSPTTREPNGKTTSPPEMDPHPRLHVLPQDRILNYFFNFFILPVRDPLARRGFLENLGPIYHNVDENSSLMLSTMAVASSMFSIRMGQNPNTTHSRSYYLSAVKAMRDQVAEQKECAGDEVLIAVLLLQLYELSVGQLNLRSNSQHTHLNGALALVRHRGAATFTGKLSLSILLYIRSLAIDESFRNNSPIPDDLVHWTDYFNDAEQIPGIRLDTINLDLARLRLAAARILPSQDPNLTARRPQIQYILAAAINIDRRLKEWQQSLPKSWAPIRVFGDQYIAPSIQKAGLYQQHCDVYRTLFLLTVWNKFRYSLIEVTRIIILCLDESPSTINLTQQEACRNNIQRLVDDSCACIPFYLGDRTEPGTPGDPSVKYPQAPGKPPVKDHYQTGPAMGGLSLIGPMTALLKMDITMREGQRMWLAGQLARTARVYRIRPPGPKERA